MKKISQSDLSRLRKEELRDEEQKPSLLLAVAVAVGIFVAVIVLILWLA